MFEYTIGMAKESNGCYVRFSGAIQYTGTLAECLGFVRAELEKHLEPR